LIFKINRYPSDEEGEAALAAVKKDMPSKTQTRYNQRDIKKRIMKKKSQTKGKKSRKSSRSKNRMKFCTIKEAQRSRTRRGTW